MEKIRKIFQGKITRKIYWLPQDMITKVEKEALRKKYRNESALIQHIVTNWFEK
jgi:hypothetical protein